MCSKKRVFFFFARHVQQLLRLLCLERGWTTCHLSRACRLLLQASPECLQIVCSLPLLRFSLSIPNAGVFLCRLVHHTHTQKNAADQPVQSDPARVFQKKYRLKRGTVVAKEVQSRRRGPAVAKKVQSRKRYVSKEVRSRKRGAYDRVHGRPHQKKAIEAPLTR